jgi:hypothetical protein
MNAPEAPPSGAAVRAPGPVPSPDGDVLVYGRDSAHAAPPAPPPAPATPGPRRLTGGGIGWVAAHGGAGTSTLAIVLGGTDLGCRWPDAGRAEPARVMLVARTHAAGLRAASRALNALREGRHPAGLELVAVVLVADAPGRLPMTLGRRIRVLRSVAPVRRVPWIAEWRLGRQAKHLPKALAQLDALIAAQAGGR